MSAGTFWTNKSVRLFSPAEDPVAAMVEYARAVALEAVESGWDGPPFDTFQLANLLGFKVIPSDSIRDARLVPIPRKKFRIEYNPVQPEARIRFSVAHEIAHTFFPDCREKVRNRSSKPEIKGDEWQLEMLCNIAAAELLMPVGSFPEIRESEFSINSLLDLRQRFRVSTEAILFRFLKLSRIPCAIFAASYQRSDSKHLTIDFVRTANGWKLPIRSGTRLRTDSVAKDCTTIGFTAEGIEHWGTMEESVRVECVAIPSYPGSDNPRVVGVLAPVKSTVVDTFSIQYLNGDASEPRGDGSRIIAHVVNDAASRWGGGFARVVGDRWPQAQRDFVEWADHDRTRLQLGGNREFRIADDLWVFHMIAQHGYRQSSRRGVRYQHLERCLNALCEVAHERSASVHMPRIGCGQAGGNWAVVEELIEATLCRNGIPVTIYTLPSERSRWERGDRQRTLFDVVNPG